MIRNRGEQLQGNVRNYGGVAKSVGGVLLAYSLLTGCGSLKDGSWQGGALSSPSWNIGHHLTKVTLACNNKKGGPNQAIITGPRGEAWGANVIYGGSGLGVGVAENPNNQFVAGRDSVEANQLVTNFGNPDHDGTIPDYSLQIHLQSGPAANQVTATCLDRSDHLQPHGPAIPITVP